MNRGKHIVAPGNIVKYISGATTLKEFQNPCTTSENFIGKSTICNLTSIFFRNCNCGQLANDEGLK
jgi:hypothetical protein